MYQPLVSVLFPVYNGGIYLEEAIKSILSQTYSNFEVIIINDGSNDGSAGLIEQFNDPRIHAYNQTNQGLAATLNRAIGLARGKYLARQDADDVSLPSRFEKQVTFLETYPDYCMVGTWSRIWEETKKTKQTHRHPTDNVILKFNLLFDTYFVHSSVMFRKAVFDKVGLYSTEKSRQPEDYELWSRIIRHGGFKVANIPEILVNYREVASSICRTGENPFVDRVINLSIENLAWASGREVTDPVITDIAALTHNAPYRFSAKPDFHAMLFVLREAACRVGGTLNLTDAPLIEQVRMRYKCIRNNYIRYWLGSLVRKIIRPFLQISKRKHIMVPAVRGTAKDRLEGLIDVVIPVYNGEKFIIQALCSVVCQTYLPNKIVVVDDGSTDKTPILVQNFKTDVPIEYIRKNNGGLSSARNAGIDRCSSDYVAFLDADDEWYPEKLAEQVRVFQDSDVQNLGVVYCKYNIIDENGDLTDKYYIVELDTSIRGKVFNKLLEANKITGSGSGVLIRRECFNKVGGFDKTLKACEDWDMWLRLAEHYEFDFVAKELVKIRRHHGNMQRDVLHMLINVLQFYEKWIKKLPVNARCFGNWRMQIAYHYAVKIPRNQVIGLIKENLSAGSIEKLFHVTFGSVRLYLMSTIPVIVFVSLTKGIKEAYRVVKRSWIAKQK